MDDDALPEFRMEVDRRPDGGTVRVHGELDLVHADDLEGALVGLGTPDGGEGGSAGRARTVVADLSDLEFLDSAGLSGLLVARHRLSVLGARLRICGTAGAARRVFEAAGLEDVLDD